MVDTAKDGFMSAGFSVWLSICVFVCLWLWGNFTKGRRNFQTNLHVIEEGLRKMQEDIDMRQREDSMGCVEDVEDIGEFLKKFYEEGNNNEQKETIDEPQEAKKNNENGNEIKAMDDQEEKEDDEIAEPEDKKTV